jgi:hypothetical protein
MRLWSVHPKYLDAKGLIALWRESLLAKHVLEGKTKGYKNHPQLERFKKSKWPVDAINHYLLIVYEEALHREYNFNKNKIKKDFKFSTIKVTEGQIEYEKKHLLNKLKIRDPEKYKQLKNEKKVIVHSMFRTTDGDIESWEIQ